MFEKNQRPGEITGKNGTVLSDKHHISFPVQENVIVAHLFNRNLLYQKEYLSLMNKIITEEKVKYAIFRIRTLSETLLLRI